MTHSIRLSTFGVASVAALLAFAPVANAIDVTVSGNVDRMIRTVDNGGGKGVDAPAGPPGGSDVQFLDNGSNQSRIRLTGREDLDGGSSSFGTGAGGPFAIGFDTELRIADTSACYNVKDRQRGFIVSGSNARQHSRMGPR